MERIKSLQSQIGPMPPRPKPETEHGPTPATPAASRNRLSVPLLRNAEDREFLPAAMEIVETPPSPSGTALLWCICLAFAAMLAWSYFGWLDVHAVAKGRVQPSGRSKVVQSMEAGRVALIKIENGNFVTAGQVVIELDPTESRADRLVIEQELASNEAEIVRRMAAIRIAERYAIDADELKFPESIPAPVRSREQQIFLSDTQQLAADLKVLQAQISEREAAGVRLKLSIDARKELIQFLQERVDTRQFLDKSGQGYRGKVLDALQELGREKTNLASEIGQLDEAEAGVRSLNEKMTQAKAVFIADHSQKLSDAERKRDRLKQELIKARTRVERLELRAPIDGTVQQLAVTTVGQVIASGQPLMIVVPADKPIEVAALIRNQDIGFIEPGQSAVIKIDAFPFTRYGTIAAKVVKVSQEAVDEKNAVSLSDPLETTRPQGASIASDQHAPGASLVFPVTLSLEKPTLTIDGKEVQLSPGMAATVEIKTAARRAIDYILSPVREVVASSGHER